MSVASFEVPDGLIGSSAVAERIREDVNRASRCSAKVLITGESGVGKEVVARLIHQQSSRRSRPFVALNCAALPESLLESELFGHVRGSFTGAFRDKVGLLETADHGTVFLDEIGETSPRMQALLLRFLETGEMYRVGSDHAIVRGDVRVVSATNRRLPDMIADGRFRRDLYYRLNVLSIEIPPLRERREDIPLFLTHFSRVHAAHHQVVRPQYSAAAQEVLVSYDWPGNVREVRNMSERLTLLETPTLDVRDLPQEVFGTLRKATAAATPAGPIVRPIVTELLEAMFTGGASFWATVYPLFAARDLTREELRLIVTEGLRRAQGSYRGLVHLFNMPQTDYKRFLNFLRKHQCHVPWLKFRATSAPRANRVAAGAGAGAA